MNKAIKVLLINVAVVFGCSLLLFLAAGGNNYNLNDFLISLGLTCLAAAVLGVLVSIILFMTGPAQYEVAKGFLLSAGVLLLAGFTACSSTTINLH